MQSVANIVEVVSNFNCEVDVESLRAFGSGHINDTYFLKNSTASGEDYLLQRINHHIFKDVDQLTQNMCRVIAHLKNKVKTQGAGDPDKEVMTLIPAIDGKYYYRDSTGDYWRLCLFLKDTRSYDVVENTTQAFQGGEAFGKFQKMLSDLPSGLLFDVIPDFHNIQKRLAALNEAAGSDPLDRMKKVLPELEYISTHAQQMLYFQQPQQQLALPKRVTHNDTKFNNVLLDKNDQAQCVIDLDTVMDGYIAYDFGDAIRTIINTAAEDEADLDKIKLNMPLFEAYTKGYLKEAGQFLTGSEVDSLVMGALLLPYMQAVRFLTDYISGDHYFKVKFDGHNLQRTRAQLQLHKLLHENADALQTIINNEMAVYQQKQA
ncbi:aminoglycoside phosphotransferase family protein [Mucilaginibacter gynuensis]|uniref:Aminoglycoside phosphotransferase family protein n=1 Tax=Mucilaginibacter gynuensis TaxID=1302236 RepID=A0ABP8FXZ8_9SPHI